eukprot:jgi/Botrbrau1/5195/Bobra.0172s0063.1
MHSFDCTVAEMNSTSEPDVTEPASPQKLMPSDATLLGSPGSIRTSGKDCISSPGLANETGNSLDWDERNPNSKIKAFYAAAPVTPDINGAGYLNTQSPGTASFTESDSGSTGSRFDTEGVSSASSESGGDGDCEKDGQVQAVCGGQNFQESEGVFREQSIQSASSDPMRVSEVGEPDMDEAETTREAHGSIPLVEAVTHSPEPDGEVSPLVSTEPKLPGTVPNAALCTEAPAAPSQEVLIVCSSNPEICSSSDVTPPSTPPGRHSANDHLTDDGGSEGSEGRDQLQAMLPEGAHNAAPFVPTRAEGSGQVSKALNAFAPEFVPQSFQAVSEAAPKDEAEPGDETVPEDYVDPSASEFWDQRYPTEAPYYYPSGWRMYYPVPYFQVCEAGGYWPDSYVAWDPSFEGGEEDGYAQFPYAGSVDYDGIAMGAETPDERGERSSLTNRCSREAPSLKGGSVTLESPASAPSRRSTQHKRGPNDSASAHGLSEVLQEHLPEEDAKQVLEVLLGTRGASMEEVLDRWAQHKAEKRGLLRRPGQMDSNPALKLDDEDDFPSLNVAAKKTISKRALANIQSSVDGPQKAVGANAGTHTHARTNVNENTKPSKDSPPDAKPNPWTSGQVLSKSLVSKPVSEKPTLEKPSHSKPRKEKHRHAVEATEDGQGDVRMKEVVQQASPGDAPEKQPVADFLKEASSTSALEKPPGLQKASTPTEPKTTQEEPSAADREAVKEGATLIEPTQENLPPPAESLQDPPEVSILEVAEATHELRAVDGVKEASIELEPVQEKPEGLELAPSSGPTGEEPPATKFCNNCLPAAAEASGGVTAAIELLTSVAESEPHKVTDGEGAEGNAACCAAQATAACAEEPRAGDCGDTADSAVSKAARAGQEEGSGVKDEQQRGASTGRVVEDEKAAEHVSAAEAGPVGVATGEEVDASEYVKLVGAGGKDEACNPENASEAPAAGEEEKGRAFASADSADAQEAELQAMDKTPKSSATGYSNSLPPSVSVLEGDVQAADTKNGQAEGPPAVVKDLPSTKKSSTMRAWGDSAKPGITTKAGDAAGREMVATDKGKAEKKADATLPMELRAKRNLYFLKAIESHRNGNKKAARELIQKGCEALDRMIEAHADLGLPIVAEQRRGKGHSGVNKGHYGDWNAHAPRAVPIPTAGSKAGANRSMDGWISSKKVKNLKQPGIKQPASHPVKPTKQDAEGKPNRKAKADKAAGKKA